MTPATPPQMLQDALEALGETVDSIKAQIERLGAELAQGETYTQKGA